jgi:uncharacterized protein with von Willebrand factor type A (vWA) domain
MTLRFDLETDRPLVARDTETRYVLASVVAPEGVPRERPPVNLGLVLDHSGSMSGEKIRLSKDAAVAAIRRLDARDRFAVVAYDDCLHRVRARCRPGHPPDRGTRQHRPVWGLAPRM